MRQVRLWPHIDVSPHLHEAPRVPEVGGNGHLQRQLRGEPGVASWVRLQNGGAAWWAAVAVDRDGERWAATFMLPTFMRAARSVLLGCARAQRGVRFRRERGEARHGHLQQQQQRVGSPATAHSGGHSRPPPRHTPACGRHRPRPRGGAGVPSPGAVLDAPHHRLGGLNPHLPQHPLPLDANRLVRAAGRLPRPAAVRRPHRKRRAAEVPAQPARGERADGLAQGLQHGVKTQPSEKGRPQAVVLTSRPHVWPCVSSSSRIV